MDAKLQTASADRRLQAPERNDRRPKLALRQRASDHPMAMFSVLGASALTAMLLLPTTGPAFASLHPPANIIDGAQTTTRTSRLPMPAIDFACKGQAWGAETRDCLRVIAEQSGTRRAIRMIANAGPQANTPNTF